MIDVKGWVMWQVDDDDAKMTFLATMNETDFARTRCELLMEASCASDLQHLNEFRE